MEESQARLLRRARGGDIRGLLRLDGAVSGGRGLSADQLPVHGGLRRSRVLLQRGAPSARVEGSVPLTQRVPDPWREPAESRQITQADGFATAARRKYGSVNVWRYCTDIFGYLGEGALIDNKVFYGPASLSPTITRPPPDPRRRPKQEVPPRWSPCATCCGATPRTCRAGACRPRGAGYLFGDDVCKQFNENNKIPRRCARAHQLVLVPSPSKWMFVGLVTVWSAPTTATGAP